VITQAGRVDEAVAVTVPMLVRLSRDAATLPLRAGRILAGRGGDYQSPFRGRGIEFDESRPYQPGDDIRNIDWRVTARTGRPHTKVFREERERPVFVWIDLRPSMFFATRRCYKAVAAAEIAGLLAWSAERHGDRVGGVVFSEDVHHEIRPQRGRRGVLRLIRQLASHPVWQSGSRRRPVAGAASRALVRLRRVARPGSLVFLISDFREFDDQAWTEMSRLSRHHDVVMIFVHDPVESSLPGPGLYRVSDGEGEHELDTFNPSVVDAHRDRFEKHLSLLRGHARTNGFYLLSCSTADAPLRVLQDGLLARRGRG
jgi:uncharacterized protein (DUF58 family)